MKKQLSDERMDQLMRGLINDASPDDASINEIADYDGDGRADTAVFRPSTGTWYVNRSTQGTLITAFGSNGDQPAPSAYVP